MTMGGILAPKEALIWNSVSEVSAEATEIGKISGANIQKIQKNIEKNHP